MNLRKLLFLTVSIIAALHALAYDFMVDGIAYNITSPITVEVTYTEVAKENINYQGVTKVIIPTTVTNNGTTYSVTSIGKFAFRTSRKLINISLPESITTIGYCAFDECSSLTSITIPNSVTSIGEFAFSGCTALASIVVETGNTTYDSRDNCNAIIETESNTLICGCKSTIIPGSVTSIGEGAFSDCTGLTSIDIPHLLTTIEHGAFSGCVSLKSIEIPNSVTSIGEFAFYYCSGLTSVTIPNSVTSIGAYAFYECTGLTNIDIPNSVTSIGEHAFSGIGLTNITIPKSVLSIGDEAFSACSGLESIVVDNGNPIYDSRENCNAIIETATNTLIAGCIATIIPNSVTAIGSDAFWCCAELKSVSIPGSVLSISKYAFSQCSSLTSITIPNSVISIGDYAFSSCTGLTSIEIPNSVTSIGDCVFSGCRSLADIYCKNVDPSNVKLGTGVFNNVPKSTCVLHVPVGTAELYRATDQWRDFTNIVEEIMDPSESISFADEKVKQICVANWDTNGDGELSYEEAQAVTDLGNAFEENEEITSFDELKYFTSLTEIGNSTFSDCTNLTNISIPNSVTVIGSNAFYICDGLTSITIPNSVTSIGEDAFYGCTGLTSITIPNSVTTIGDDAFCGCSGLTSIDIPNSVTSIGDYAFSDCSGLTSIVVDKDNPTYDSRQNSNAIIEKATNKLVAGCKATIIPNSVTAIGRSAFLGCSGLTSITIPNSVTSIGDNAFYYCRGLTSITIPKSVTAIGERAFDSCPGLTSIVVDQDNPTYDSRENCNAIIETATNKLVFGCKATIIPNSVTLIGSNAFSGCTGLTSITIPNSVTSIGAYAFSACYGLTDIYCNIAYPSNVTLGAGVFYYVPRTTCVLHVPVGTAELYRATDQWRDFTNIVEEIMDPSEPISFADEKVKQICVANWDTNGDGELSYEEAQAVTDLGTVFKNNQEITSFDELQYFTSLTKIGNSTFYDCTNLTNISIPNSVTEIGSNAFGHCRSLTSITIPNSVTIIKSGAFIHCTGLTSMTIPNSVTTIEYGAFSSCRSLTSITIPNSVTSIGQEAFSYCTGLTSIIVDNDNPIYDSRENCNAIIKTATNKLVAGCQNTIIPNSVTSIGNSAFSGCTGLTSVTIPNSVTSIGYDAFSACTGLTSVTIPNSVTSIGDNTFYYCESLTSIVVEKDNPIYDSRENCNAIIETATNKLVAGCQNTIIPNSVTSIGNSAFSFCSGLTNITIPNSVTSIGDDAFYSCDGLTSVTIPNSVTSIGEYAFDYCTDLTDIYCNIADPSNVTLGSGVFKYAPKSTCVLHVPAGTAELYRATDQWSDFTNIVEEPATTLYGETVTWHRGQDRQISVAISMDNEDEVSAIEADIYLPTGWSFAQVDGDNDITLADDRKARDHSVESNTTASGKTRLLISSASSKAIKGNSGTLLTMNIIIPDGTPLGDYNINIRNIEMAMPGGNGFSISDTTVTVSLDYLVGDVNADASIDISDYVLTANEILELEPSPFWRDAADVNLDSRINVQDLVGITNIAVGKTEPSSRRARANAEPILNSDNSLSMVATDHALQVGVDNTVSFTALQLDLHLPEGVEVTDAVLTDRAPRHSIATSRLADGTVRVLISSPVNAVIDANSGTLFTLTLTGTAQQTSAVATVTEAMIVTPSEVAHRLSDTDVSLNGISGITALSSDGISISATSGTIIVSGTDDVRIYTLSGALVSTSAETRLAPGIYVVVAAGNAYKIQLK